MMAEEMSLIGVCMVGHIRFVEGMKALLWHKQILLKQFGGWAEKLTEQLKEVSCQKEGDPDGKPDWLP